MKKTSQGDSTSKTYCVILKVEVTEGWMKKLGKYF